MAKVNILFVDHTPFVGGAQLCLANHIKYLDRKKFNPNVLIDKLSKHESIYIKSKVKIHKINFSTLKSINALKNLKSSVDEFSKLVEKINPDIVLANTTRALIISALGKKNFKLVSYIRDYDYPKWLLKILRRKVDYYLSVSKSIDDFYNLNSKIIYLGTDIYKKKVSSKKIISLKKKWGINDKDLVIGFAGRLVDWKGPQLLIDAFSQIDQSNLKLILFGTGKNQKGSVEDYLKKNLNPNIILAGHIEDNALIYKLIDVFVLPSLKPEPFSTSLIEASFMGLPIIATNIGGTPEFIKHNNNGLLVKANDTKLLTKALVRLIKDKKLAKSLGAQAFRDAQSYTEENLTKKLEKIYLMSL